MFDSREIAERALVRAEIIKKEQAVRKRKIYGVSAVAACLALVVGISFFIPSVAPGFVDYGSAGAHGAMLVDEAVIGGYVLIGVIGFALGAAVTIFCYKMRGGKTPGGRQDDRDD